MISIIGAPGGGTEILGKALFILAADPGLDEPSSGSEASHQGVVNLNRDVLTALGGSWSNPPPFPPGWVEDHALSSIRARARDVAKRLPDQSLVEDPMLSLVQPMWEHVGTVTSTVACLRAPAATANALATSHRLDMDQGLFLWFRYIAAAALNRPDATWVEYESLTRDPNSEIRRVCSQIGLEATETTLLAASNAFSAVFPDTPGHDLPETPVGVVCRRLYDTLTSGQPVASDQTAWIWARLVTELPWGGPGDRDVRRARRETVELGLQLRRMTKESRRSNRRVRRLESDLQLALARIDELTTSQTLDLLQAWHGADS